MVSDQDGGLLSRMKERRVFLFEQIVIFSEPIDKKKGFTSPGYLFKNNIKVSAAQLNHLQLLDVSMMQIALWHLVEHSNCFPTTLPFCSFYSVLCSSLQVSWLGLEENADDPCKFTLTSRSSSGNLERYTLHSMSPGVSRVWVHQVSQILENQRNFLNGKIKIITFQNPS